jgi:hypothetical protein
MNDYGQQTPTDTATEYGTLIFIIEQQLKKLATVTLVKVMSVTNSGGVAPVGMVSVQPLVNQIDGQGNSQPHGIINNIPYFRIQGGANAVILDPQVGDIGMCAFCSRDISAVKNSSPPAQANPGSFRIFDYADGLYLGGFLNGVPSQYVDFSGSGLTLVSPQAITLQAPNISLQATDSIVVNSPANNIEGGGTKVDGKTFLTHQHTEVQSGGSESGPVF